MEENNKQESSRPDRFLVPGAIVVSGLIVAGAILFVGGDFSFRGGRDAGGKAGQETAAGGAAVESIEDDDPSLGNPAAPVVLVEFSDFQCPFCRMFWRNSMPQIKDKYIKTGEVRLVYRDFPLYNIHPAAEVAAIAGECAEDQGEFWEMHDKIFSEQDKFGEGTVQFGVPELKQWAREVGLDGEEFDACLDGAKYKSEVAKDVADGAALGVTGTPHVFVNGKLLIRGALPFEQIDRIIQQELAGQ